MTAPRPLGYWLTTLGRLLDEQVADAVEATGLSRAGWQVLSRLAQGGVVHDRVAELLAPFAGSDVEDAVRGLEKDGLVEHQGNEVRLTAAGHARVAELQDGPVQAVVERATEDLDQQEYDVLVGALEKVARSLGWLESVSD
ncbi:MarR family winged helix-turn-helix transcriptional regulator [Nocardioides ginsengisoli]|uniref:MarR family winged helix-turn-helix transcriptional regulator n=1 Tax=Nocardioides ginsengisoli TaxID=363868 RepID=A0ABW3WAB8_9ACTN